MQLSDTFAALVRCWYVVVTGVLVTAVMGWIVYQTVPTTYEASGSLLLVPSEATVGVDGNPFLALNGMVDARDVILRRADSDDNREALLGQVKGSDFSVGADPTTPSPIVSIQTEARTPEAALALLGAVLVNVDQQLSSMQAELEVPEDRQIQTRVLVADRSAEPNTRGQLRAAIAAVAAGIAGTILLTGLVDGILSRRRTRLARNAMPGTAVRDAMSDASPTQHSDAHAAHSAPATHVTPASSQADEVRGDGPTSSTMNGRSAPLDVVRLRVHDVGK